MSFKEAIRKNGLTNTKAAELLGVKRQTLWLYLSEKSAPGTEVLRKASKHWKLSLGDGYILTTGAFGPATTTLPERPRASRRRVPAGRGACPPDGAMTASRPNLADDLGCEIAGPAFIAVSPKF